MTRTDIINLLIKKFDYQSYLEIGTQFPQNNFDKIIATHKVSIDPFPAGPVTFTMTSDDYFKMLDDTKSDAKFDIVFIDGLHHDDQVLRDVDNSLRYLSDNGVIVCHDCLPTADWQTTREDNGREWTGDVWKAIARMRVERIDLSIFVVDTDWGCGVIRPGTNVPYKPYTENYLTFNYYIYERNRLMNVISREHFLQVIQ